MKRIQAVQIRSLFSMCLALGVAAGVTPQAGEKKWNFDSSAEGKPPAGFTLARTGQGSEGQWVVTKDDSAPSKPNVLAQTSQDKTDYRFPLAIAEGTNYKDAAVSVKFKAVAGSVDQGAGLAFRLKDKDNYYVVRANALEDNFRLYRVVKGRRVQFAGANLKVTSREWYEIKVEARGDEIKCYYDGQLKITATDHTFPNGGGIGLWTKADSVIYFDDLTARELGGAAKAASPPKTFAQALVEEFAAKHAGLVRIGLHVTPPDSTENLIIASNAADKIGQKSDPEDLEAMKTGKAVVLKEGENFDVTLPLHDAAGRLIGAIGLTMKPQRGEQKSGAALRARELARAVEKRIPDKAALSQPAG